MNNLTKVEFGVTAIDGIAMVSSRKVAEIFNKRHDDVLKAVRNAGCSVEFRHRNFAESYYKDLQGKRQPEILLTKDGFAFVVMGFTGKQAARFKEAYIYRFNEMEQLIKSRSIARLEYHELTDMIKAVHTEPKFYHFSNEADLINRIVLGMKAKEFRAKHGLAKDESIRDKLTPYQAELIQRLQKFDVGLVATIPDFSKRKQILENYYASLQAMPILIAG